MTAPSPISPLQMNAFVAEEFRKNEIDDTSYPRGYVHTMSRVRPILTHPLGLTLTALFYDQVLPQQYQMYPSFLTELEISSSSSIRMIQNRVFGAAMNMWNDPTNTRDFMDHLIRMLRATSCTTHSVLKVDGYFRLPPKQDSEASQIKHVPGKLDIVLYDQQNGMKSVVTAINVFSSCDKQEHLNQLWWNKMHEAITFLESHRTSTDKEIQQLCFKKPMLMVNVIIDHQKEENTFVARLGCFLCIRKNTNNHEFRLSLLWRDEIRSAISNEFSNSHVIAPVSKAFGKILHASMLCWKYRDLQSHVDHHYLSASCSLFGNTVLRCYDTRIQATDQRRPSMYLCENETTGKSAIFPLEPCAESVLSVNDHYLHDHGNHDPLLEYGDPIPMDVTEYDWLWQFRGRLLIVATPFREGYHFARHPIDFMPIIEHLEHLHNEGFVHGDIRAYNMVMGTNDWNESSSGASSDVNDPAFSKLVKDSVSGKIRDVSLRIYDRMKRFLSTHACIRPIGSVHIPSERPGAFDASRGCLIDFDFGGKQGPATVYPSGYNNMLADGYRIGRPDEMIHFRDDWHALVMVLFQVHVFYPPPDIVVPPKVYEYFARQAEDVVSSLCVTGPTNASSIETGEKVKAEDILKLKRFLHDMEVVGYLVSKRV